MRRHGRFTWMQFTLESLFLCITSCTIGVAQAMKTVEVRVPTRPVAGSTVRLDCIFDLENDVLHSVKWFKDQNEFYRFSPGGKPSKKFFPIKGIHAYPTMDEDSSVNLEQVNRSASGTYRCEVSSDDPSFRAVADSKDLVVDSPDASGSLQVVEAESRSVKVGRSRPLREALGGPPTEVSAEVLSARSVKVTWKPPSPTSGSGEIRGYYIGYRPATPEGPYLYKATDVPVEERGQYLLTSLSPATRYSVILQAYSDQGAWTRSDEVIFETSNSDPPSAPLLKVAGTGITSVSLTWKQPQEDLNPVTGYYVRHREADGEWNETHVLGKRRSLTVDKLQCGSKHQFAVRGYNEAGTGNLSETVTVRTDGTTPVAPDRQSLLQPQVSSVAVTLGAWHDGGCPIHLFRVQYRRLLDKEWTVLGTVPSRDSQITISDLSPDTAYLLLVTAHNDVGATDAEYEFTTLPVPREKLANMDVPLAGVLGEEVSLFCSHDFEGVPLHSVKWFKDNQEFYRFVPSMVPPARASKVEGVIVNELHSNASSVHLEQLSASTGGTYRCEISSGPPLYRTAVDEMDLVIAERLPATPRLSTDKEVYQLGDTAHLTCTAVGSKPPLGLFLFINDKPVDDLKASLDTDPHGLQTLTVRMSFLPEQKKSEDGSIRVKCTTASRRIFETVEVEIKVQSQQRQPSNEYYQKDECLAKALAIIEKAWVAFSEGHARSDSVKQKMREDM